MLYYIIYYNTTLYSMILYHMIAFGAAALLSGGWASEAANPVDERLAEYGWKPHRITILC